MSVTETGGRVVDECENCAEADVLHAIRIFQHPKLGKSTVVTIYLKTRTLNFCATAILLRDDRAGNGQF